MRLTRGHRLSARHREVKQNSKKFAAGKDLETGKWKPYAVQQQTQFITPMHTHVITHRYTT